MWSRNRKKKKKIKRTTYNTIGRNINTLSRWWWWESAIIVGFPEFLSNKTNFPNLYAVVIAIDEIWKRLERLVVVISFQPKSLKTHSWIFFQFSPPFYLFNTKKNKTQYIYTVSESNFWGGGGNEMGSRRKDGNGTRGLAREVG